MVEITVPLGEFPLPIDAPVDVGVIAGADDALVVASYPHFDRAGTVGIVRRQSR